MPENTDEKKRKRVVVEEVAPEEERKEEIISQEAPVSEESLNEAKEKVEELQTITEHMSGDLEKSVDVQEDLAKAVEEAVPATSEFKTEPTPISQNQSSNPLWIIIPGIFLLGALLGGVIFYQKSLNKAANATASPTPSSEVTPAPSASPSASLDLSKYSINVENGSGISGEAGNASNILTAAGFKVSATGNADAYSYTKTIIKTKSDVPQAFIDQVSSALSKTYVLGTSQTLPDTSSDEIVVIVGSTKAQ